MSWISRCIAPTGSALALLAALAIAQPARADAPLVASLGAQSIRFEHLSHAMGGAAIGTEDPGFAALLRATGSVLTWKSGDRYVLITTGAPTVISFAVGERSYQVGPITAQATFAPYDSGDQVFLPFDDLLHSLGFALRRDDRGAVLQPQINALDVTTSGGGVRIVARAAIALHPVKVSGSADVAVYAFDGVGTSVAGTRVVDAGGVRSVTVSQSGTVRDPQTTVRVLLESGATVGPSGSDDGRDAVLAFSGSGGDGVGGAAPASSTASALAAGPPVAEPPNPPMTPGVVAGAPSSGPATVTGVQLAPSAAGTSVTIAVSGNATYSWHRLRAPDNRFWIDILGAQLNGPAIDETAASPLGAIRVRQIDPNTVRVAISLTGQQQLDVSPSATGLTIDVGNAVVADGVRGGSGSVGGVVSVSEVAAPVTPAPLGEDAQNFGDTWKFGGSSYVPTNPHLIVIDPGHGGSDRGAIRHGTDEADVNLDMAKRLRDILLARGWQVQMTRDTDVDVYKPDDSARDELQARDDIANHDGARLFVSIHSNSYINSGPSGTTVYYAKPDDVPLARAIDRDVYADLGTRDDGIVKSHLYIPLHALMPSVLIETAFLSNPHDYALLVSPDWRQRVAEWIADGIDRYAREHPVAGVADPVGDSAQ